MALAACKAVINGDARRLLVRAMESGHLFEELLRQATEGKVDRKKREEMVANALALDRSLIDGTMNLPDVCDAYDHLNLSFAQMIDGVPG